MQMRALAMKYLTDEQLADSASQKPKPDVLKQMMCSDMQGTNMSFATMRYLQRYHLLPGSQALPNQGKSINLLFIIN